MMYWESYDSLSSLVAGTLHDFNLEDLHNLAVSSVGQPLEGEVLRFRINEIVLVELRLEDSGRRLRRQAHSVPNEQDHILGHSC